jgi:hypothetical protein
MATSAIWKAMPRPWLMTLAPILISFSFRLDSDQSLIGSGVAIVPLEQIADPVLQDHFGGQPDRKLDPLSFQILVDARRGEGGIGPEIDTPDPAAIPQDDRLEHTLPAVGAMDIAETQRASGSRRGSKV